MLSPQRLDDLDRSSDGLVVVRVGQGNRPDQFTTDWCILLPRIYSASQISKNVSIYVAGSQAGVARAFRRAANSQITGSQRSYVNPGELLFVKRH